MIKLSHLASQGNHAEAAFEGKWHAIEFQPDPSVPQRFIIGVALSQSGKLTHFRVAEEAARLRCFYGHRFGKDVWGWMRSELTTELTAAKGTTIAKFQSDSPQLSIGEGFFASGSSADAALSRTFDRIVTVVERDRKPRVQGIAQAELRQYLAESLKRSLSTRFEAIAQPEGGLQIADQGKLHTFDITYDDTHVAASAVSACYVGLDTAKLNVMQATSDLHAYAHLRTREQVGLAVLVPSEQTLPAAAVKAWRGWWDEHSYKLRQSDDVLLAEATTASELAEHITHWFTA